MRQTLIDPISAYSCKFVN